MIVVDMRGPDSLTKFQDVLKVRVYSLNVLIEAMRVPIDCVSANRGQLAVCSSDSGMVPLSSISGRHFNRYRHRSVRYCPAMLTAMY
jgi:hypothetical protein